MGGGGGGGGGGGAGEVAAGRTGRGEPGGCGSSGRGPAERAGRREEPLCEARRVGPGRPPAGSRRPRPRRTDKHGAALPLSRSDGGRPPPRTSRRGQRLRRSPGQVRGSRAASRSSSPAALRVSPRSPAPPVPAPDRGSPTSGVGSAPAPAQSGAARPPLPREPRSAPPPPRCGALSCPRRYPIAGLAQAPAALTSSSFLLLAGPRCATPGRPPPRGPAARQYLRAGGDTRSLLRPLPLRFPRAGMRLASLLLQLLNEGFGATALPLE